MSHRSGAILSVAIGLGLFATLCLAEPPPSKLEPGRIAEMFGAQQTIELKVRVVDDAGKPVADAKVAAWALRSSQGHGLWQKDDKDSHVDPKDTLTDAEGNATVLYPYFRDYKEKVRTLSVSLAVDHPEFAFRNDLHIDVPLETAQSHEIELKPGVSVEVRPLIDGESTGLDDLFAFWSDGRSWKSGSMPKKSPDLTLFVPAMPPGENSVLLVKFDHGRVTHFSKITEFTLIAGEPKKIDVTLQPALTIRGRLSDNVPRPIRAGRVKAWTLKPAEAADRRVNWWTWAPIEPDGTFVITDWPAEEPIQLIALCKGFMATSGKAPDCVKHPPDPEKDAFSRPQLFQPKECEPIELAMTPLVRCVVTTLDDDDKPVAGVLVQSCPNVCWWNSGSQIYCHPLVHGRRLDKERDYDKAVDESYPYPFEAITDAKGNTTLEMPAGNEDLSISSDIYELGVFLGTRDVRVKLSRDEITETVLHLQPRGTDKLGEWDKLAGVVFGCSTREGRRICALPSVQKKMSEFAERFREGKNQRDPKLLAEAYTTVADAFVGVGDNEEAAKWRKKATEQAEKARPTNPAAAEVTPSK